MTPRLLTNYTRWVVRHRRTVVAAILLLTLLLARATTRLHVEIDPDRQLPQDHPFIQALNDVHRIFGDKNLVVIGLFPHDGNVFTPAFLKKLAEVTDAVRRLPGANPALVQSLAAPQVKDIRGTEDGMEVERVMETPPTDEAGAAEVRRRAFATDAYVGTLVAADGSAAAVQASFELTPETPGYRHLHAAGLGALEAADDGTLDYRLSAPFVTASRSSAALSFCSLVTFRTATIRPFRLFTGFGILSALAIELTIIPAVRAMLPTPRRREREREAAAHPWLDAFLRASARAASGRGKRRVFAGAALLIAPCALVASPIQTDISTKREFSARAPERPDNAAIKPH